MTTLANFSWYSSPLYPTEKHSGRPPRSYCNQIFAKSSRGLAFNASQDSQAILIPRKNKRRCVSFDLHKRLVPYEEAWSWQKSIVEQRKTLVELNEDSSDTLIVLQHDPVYTLGTGSSEEYMNFDIKDAPFSVYRTERGGEVTYHGPGQLVMYPIINLRYQNMDLHWYTSALEEVVIRVLSSAFSIKASRVKGLTGVWVGDQKLAAIGIRVSRWITYHGLALNVTTDLTPFERIIPCGIRDCRVGTIKQLVSEQLPSDQSGACSSFEDSKLIDVTHKSLLKEFSEVFQVELHHSLTPLSEFSPESGQRSLMDTA